MPSFASSMLLTMVITVLLVVPTGSFSLQMSSTTTAGPKCPDISPVTGLKNEFYEWKHGQKIRFQRSNTNKDTQAIVLVHGLFVNSDHWRKTLLEFKDNTEYTAYALDLFGCGFSDKPPAASQIAQLCNGENNRFVENGGSCKSVLEGVTLGTAGGGLKTRQADVDLRHPLNSPYNFYTWSDQIRDFCRNIVKSDKEVILMCNSIGTISALQAVIDDPDLFQGVFVVCPNFRELHSAEVPFSNLAMPVLRAVQRLLRERGQVAFDALAKPATVKQILNEPYAITSAIDDTLVKVLLDPLLTEGASNVVFDTLSYSAGPLPEQQLGSAVGTKPFPKDKPVWVCYGNSDPWTPSGRVEALVNLPPVENVRGFPGVGHCPHDEAPELVHPMLYDFLNRLRQKKVSAPHC